MERLSSILVAKGLKETKLIVQGWAASRLNVLQRVRIEHFLMQHQNMVVVTDLLGNSIFKFVHSDDTLSGAYKLEYRWELTRMRQEAR